MDICVRRLGLHRGAPRLYLDTPALQRAGFTPGLPICVRFDTQASRVIVEACAAGPRRVSRKRKHGRDIPVIDLNGTADLRPVAFLGAVRVVFAAGVIHLLAVATHARAAERTQRLRRRLRANEPLRSASIAFGAGVTSWALHRGLQDAGVPVALRLANEIDAGLAQLVISNHPQIGPDTVVVNAAMQDAVADRWLLDRVGQVDILEAGIPCSGASRAGVAKRGLQRMEDHPLVGHLVAAVIQWIAALQPAVFLAENVPDYAGSASAAILRAWLRDAGYAIQELVLDAADFGSLEARRRWFLVAHPPGLVLDPDRLARATGTRPVLSDVLDAVPDDDPAWREVPYLKSKALRDEEKGSGFAMQWLDASAERVPTLRKGYHKGGSTDPRLRHPTRHELSRLLSAAEHARIKGIPSRLIDGLSSTLAHQACGQSVDTRPVKALGRWLGEALQAMRGSWRAGTAPTALDDQIAA
jgi:DNA (cytosine-5)-methyltransferase 1